MVVLPARLSQGESLVCRTSIKVWKTSQDEGAPLWKSSHEGRYILVTVVERKWTAQIRASFPSEKNFVYRQLSGRRYIVTHECLRALFMELCELM